MNQVYLAFENHLIQIDSAVNGGNSGGPLLNNNNEVIGIISSKIMFADGVGYAIPINLLRIFSNMKSDRIIYNNCNLLAKFSNTSEDRIKMINNLVNSNIESGITISELSKTSILKKNNLEIGDLIIEFDNNKINIITNYHIYYLISQTFKTGFEKIKAFKEHFIGKENKINDLMIRLCLHLATEEERKYLSLYPNEVINYLTYNSLFSRIYYIFKLNYDNKNKEEIDKKNKEEKKKEEEKRKNVLKK